MDKLKKYKSFESASGSRSNNEIFDHNYEEKIDQIIMTMLKKKRLISMLKDTITHVKDEIEKDLPVDIISFLKDLNEYDFEIQQKFGEISEYLIDGYPNIKDMIETIETNFIYIEEYMKMKDQI